MEQKKGKRFLAMLIAGVLLLGGGTLAVVLGTRQNQKVSDATNENVATSEMNNLLQNSEFNDGTNGWYATGGSLEAVTGEDDNTYARIEGRTANWNCVVQDITALVENGCDYTFSFDVRLSDEYIEARTVQLCTTKKDSNDESEVYDSLPVEGGSASVAPGEWTTITGTLSVRYTGVLEKLEFKISEQGAALSENYFGSYEVDNVKLFAVEKESLTIEEDIKDLKVLFAEEFGGKAGVAIPYGALTDDARMALVTKHYNSITAENEMKPESLLGQKPNIGEDGYPILNYENADTMLDYVLNYNAANPESPILVRGHVLVWHSQTPEWFFHENYDATQPYVTTDVMNARMENYIAQVMAHYHGEESPYCGLIYAWDVVNEAINDGDGGLRTDSSWYNVYGDEEFILKAFTYANQYAPAEVKLFYNDYNETNAQKCEGICKLLETIKVEPMARIDGMGMQGHYSMEAPTVGQFEQAVHAYAAIVDEIQITELDMKSGSDYDGSDQRAEYTKQAYRYKDFFDKITVLSSEGVNISGVTLWGTHDGASWLQSSNSVGGSADGSRPQCPLLFDDNLNAKPAYWALVDPSRLEPLVRNITILQTIDGSMERSDAVSYQRNGTEVSFKTAWNQDGISVWVRVEDEQNSDSDAVTVYIDRENTASDGAAVESFTVARSEAAEVDGGYEAEVVIPMTKITAAEKIGFDIAVNNDGEICSFNDLKNTQASGSKYYAQAMFKPYMVIEKGTAVIDGEPDTVWEDVSDVPLAIVTGSVAASAKVKLLWDEKNLYVYALVEDPVLNADAADEYQQDSLEVFIDENNHKSDAYETDDKQYRISYENLHSFNGSECKEDYVTSEVTITDTGYVIESAYAWTEIMPQAGSGIGIELQLNEADETGNRTGTLSWFDESGMGWSSPSVFGTAILVETKK
ncbi:MAG: endo-1,4-beta-xylanase [Clostridiales bacterium]|nr:endo-1,4-beta-xylanase [Roseburia sp.]MDD7638114.1 endo-1,4-beta-xylanase [Clostridiales bacterium]MDY4113308.1 endo-1,4-beta-xylanase [Roseburia sp.]